MTELLHSKGVRALREAIASGSVTIASAVQEAFDAAQRSQAQLHAFIYLPEAPAVNHGIGESPPHAPLAGVPVAVKDLIDTADMPTALGSPAYAGRRPQHDAWVVQRLRAAGATVLGKTVTTEFAWRHPGATTNPWHHGHTPGGSSSGSAAAVGAGIVPLALGTQTYGSVIRPAAYCGVVGMKPTYGTIARTGVLPLAGSLDHLGLFANSVGDIAYVLPLLAGTDDGDPHGFPAALDYPAAGSTTGSTSDATSAASRPPQAARGLAGGGHPRIGVLQQQIGGAIEPAQQQALDALAARLKADGAELVNVELPGEMANAQGLAWTLVCVEAALTHRELFDRSPEQVSAVMRELIEEGRRIPATDYANAKALQVQMTTRFKRWFTASVGLDALLVAPASGEAPQGLDYTGDAAFCAPWTLLGVPAINLPIGFGPAGLPLGAQLIGALGDDVALLSLAAWVEARTGWEHAVQARGRKDGK